MAYVAKLDKTKMRLIQQGGKCCYLTLKKDWNINNREYVFNYGIELSLNNYECYDKYNREPL